MGLQSQLSSERETLNHTMMQLSVLLCATTVVLGSPVADPKAFGIGYGHVSPCVTEPEAQYGHHLGYGCVETTHQVCQPGKPIFEDVTEDVETCSVTSKEVCEDVQKAVPKTTCKTHKLNH